MMELSVLDRCVLWGCVVVVPPQGREAVLLELHVIHPCTSKIKALAHGYIILVAIYGALFSFGFCCTVLGTCF